MPIIRQFFFLVLLFSFIYPVIWNFFPIAFSRIMGVLGFVYVIVYVKSNYVTKQYRNIVIGYALVAMVTLIQTLFTDAFDLEFLKKIIFVPLLNYFGALFLYLIVSKEEHTFGRLCDYILTVAMIQAIISFAMFITPGLSDSVFALIDYDQKVEELHESLTYRLTGIGQAYWGAGINYGMDLLILTLLPDIKGSYIYEHKFLYWPITAIVILAGIFSARTFFISFIFVALYFVLMRKNVFSTIVNSYKYILIIPIFLFLYQYLGSNLGERFDRVESHAFELFNNYEESGELESSSTNTLRSMYDILPTETKTWIIGDGHFRNADGSYYMHTDIGYFRQIFFYGLIGLFVYIMVVIYLYRKCYHQYTNPAIRIFLIVMMLFELTLNLKALITLTTYLGLFLAWGIMNRNKEHETLINRELINYMIK